MYWKPFRVAALFSVLKQGAQQGQKRLSFFCILFNIYREERERSTRAEKSVTMMLKKFMDTQDQQDKHFINLEKQRIEEERKWAERQDKIRQDELQLLREQLQEQRFAREAREARDRRQDEMMNALILQMSGRY